MPWPTDPAFPVIQTTRRAAAQKRRDLIYADFLRFPSDGRRHELMDGVHVMTPRPDIAHQRASGGLLLQLHARVAQRGGEVLTAPIGLKLSSRTVLQPDLLLVLDNEARSLRGLVDQAPDLVIEILSPSTQRNDRGRKLRLYADAGVPEYWVVDLRHQCVEQFALRDGRYQLLGKRTKTIAMQAAPGMRVDLTRLW